VGPLRAWPVAGHAYPGGPGEAARSWGAPVARRAPGRWGAFLARGTSARL